MSTSVSVNLAQVRKRIELACHAAGRSLDAVQLLAVSKTMPAQAVRDAYAAGQLAFGENYIQEGVDKIASRQTCLWCGTALDPSRATRPSWWPNTLRGYTALTV
jgi:uncharacterized pyridoxal phosphate-containing UPF0001 family protein